jgi:dTDP-4-amino-4,6-dideoxygalactose transaminase
MTTGEGGMLTTNKVGVAKYARVMRLHGMSRDGWRRYEKNGSWKYEVKRPGYKYNMTDMTAALGRMQLKRLDGFVRKQRRLVAEYNKLLAGVEGVKMLTDADEPGNSFHLMSILVEENKRDELIEGMKKRGVGASVHFQPVHLFEHYRKKYGYSRGSLPVTEELGRRLISLPLYVGMSKGDVEYVVQVLREVLDE